MFLSAILSFILYALVFLRMRGNIVVDGLYIRFRLAKNENWRGRLFAQNYALGIARQMLLCVCKSASRSRSVNFESLGTRYGLSSCITTVRTLNWTQSI